MRLCASAGSELYHSLDETKTSWEPEASSSPHDLGCCERVQPEPLSLERPDLQVLESLSRLLLGSSGWG